MAFVRGKKDGKMVVLEYQVARIVLQILRKGRRFIFEVAFNDQSSQKPSGYFRRYRRLNGFVRGNVLHMNLRGIVKKKDETKGKPSLDCNDLSKKYH